MWKQALTGQFGWWGNFSAAVAYVSNNARRIVVGSGVTGKVYFFTRTR